MISYLGDPDENGGSAEHPLRTHLHFGVRVGQRADYPGDGWRMSYALFAIAILMAALGVYRTIRRFSESGL
jgi:hypothetical protein